jgi:hypothetical protein
MLAQKHKNAIPEKPLSRNSSGRPSRDRVFLWLTAYFIGHGDNLCPKSQETIASFAAGLDTLCERLLRGHGAVKGVAAVYQKGKYLSQRQEALKMWEESIVGDLEAAA